MSPSSVILTVAAALCISSSAISAPAMPSPAQNTAHTTPMTQPSAPRVLPQARQVNNPTGPVPNAQKWNSPPPLPQARGIRDCGTAHPKNCN